MSLNEDDVQIMLYVNIINSSLLIEASDAYMHQ